MPKSKGSLKYAYSGKFDPQKLGSLNIDKQSTQLMPQSSKVLELGCATGFMSRYFSEVKGCQVYGVEIDPQMARKAKANCHKVIVGDLDKLQTWQQIKKYAPFDVVFVSSVIEHLKHPHAALCSAGQVLKPSGLLIITTPNIAHWRMRLQLLQGKWDYQQYGTLDNTHLRFFTYFTFPLAVKTAGFSLEHIGIDPAGGIKYFNWFAKHFPNLYAHQIVIKARKS